MKAGFPLTDDDRWPWLRSLSSAMIHELDQQSLVVVACSALQPQYRQFLIKELQATSAVPLFALLEPSSETLENRVSLRQAETHFMPASLLQSQLHLLKYDESEWYLHIHGSPYPPVEDIVETLVARLTADGVVKPSD